MRIFLLSFSLWFFDSLFRTHSLPLFFLLFPSSVCIFIDYLFSTAASCHSVSSQFKRPRIVSRNNKQNIEAARLRTLSVRNRYVPVLGVYVCVCECMYVSCVLCVCLCHSSVACSFIFVRWMCTCVYVLICI